MDNGRVVKLVGEKGFGFIRKDGEDRDLFFHASGMKTPGTFDEVNEGDRVTFTVDPESDRPRAIGVAVV